YLGNFYHAFFPHALVVLWLASWPLALRSAPVLWWWLLPLLIGMELSFVRVNGYWVAGFRNFRHAHVFVYPIVLLVAGYLAALRPDPGPAARTSGAGRVCGHRRRARTRLHGATLRAA